MGKNALLFSFLLVMGLQSLSAQSNFHLDVNLHVGGGALFHQTDFEVSPLVYQYNIIREVYRRDGYTYSWENFEEDFGLKQSFSQLRFGFSANLSYRDWPVFFLGEAMSSPSSYTKMAYSGMLGLGKDFSIGDGEYFFTGKGGMKFVFRDYGFGATTLVNSVRDDYMRDQLEPIFDPKWPFGQPRGWLFALRGGAGKTFGEDKKMSAGVEFYGELDLTDKIQRPSRMTNMGFSVYARFKFL